MKQEIQSLAFKQYTQLSRKASFGKERRKSLFASRRDCMCARTFVLRVCALVRYALMRPRRAKLPPPDAHVVSHSTDTTQVYIYIVSTHTYIIVT